MQMANDKVQLFEDQPIRTAWVENEEEWYFWVVDVVGALTEQIDYEKARKYWNKLKQRLKEAWENEKLPGEFTAIAIKCTDKNRI